MKALPQLNPSKTLRTSRASRDKLCRPLCKEEFFPSVRITLRHMVGCLEKSFVRCDHASPQKSGNIVLCFNKLKLLL